MKLHAVYLHFNEPLHLGNYKPEGYDKSEVFLRSDKLLAALMATWSKMGQSYWIEDYYKGEPDFILSSAFPFSIDKEGGKRITFYPRPKAPLPLEKFDPDRSKKIKKVQWLDSYYFEKVIKQETIHEFGEDDRDLQHAFLSHHEVQMPYVCETQERVQVSRDLSEDARPFVLERIRFNDGAGLYFLVKGKLDKLQAGLDLLQYEGLGTDRNVGNGKFSYEINAEEVQLPQVQNPDASMNLGLYCPESKNELDQMTPKAYSLIQRGGWITSDQGQGLRKHTIYMMEEGSVFGNNVAEAGKAKIDLTPQIMDHVHPIYRSGRSIFLPIKAEL